MKELKHPRDWSEISLSQWKELKELKPEEFDGIIDFQIEKYSILMDIDAGHSYWFSIKNSDFIELNRRYAWINREPVCDIKPELAGMSYRGFTGLTLGEYIDLDNWSVSGFVENAERICAVMYRQTKVGEWGQEIIEPYGVYSTNSRVELFEGLGIMEVYPVVDAFLKYRDRLMSRYEPLFSNPDDDESEEGEEEEKVRRTPEQAQQEEMEKRMKRWSWEKLIYDITEGDITKYEGVMRLPVVFVLNTLSMRLELGI